MWRHVGLLQTDVSEEIVDSIFKVVKIKPARKSVRQLFFFARDMSSTLKMESTCPSETSVYNRPTRGHIPEDGILHNVKLSICLT